MKEYHYAYRGGPRLNGPHDPDAASRIKEHRAAAYRAMAKIRHISDNRALLKREEVAIRWSLAAKLVRNAVFRAKKRGVPMTLTSERVFNLLREQGMRCAVSGLPFQLEGNIDRRYTRNPFAPSLDRIDCSKGYTAANVRIVLTACNIALNEWGEENFRMIAKAVTEHRS